MTFGLPRWRTKVFPLILASLFVAVDQVSKLWIRYGLTAGESIPEEGLVRLTRVANQGIILGLDVPVTLPLLLSTVTIASVLFFFYRFNLHRSTLIRLATAFFVGGALGNMIDRLCYGEVTDFIDVQVWSGPVRSVFNPADLFIMAGIAIMVFLIVRLRLRMPSEAYLIPYVWRRLLRYQQDRDILQ